MTSKIVVNNIEADAGVSTVFFNSDIGATDGTLNVDGNLTVDGVITYEDVTNVDSVGIVTARSGLHVTGGSVGIGTDNPTTEFEVLGAGTVASFRGTGGSSFIGIKDEDDGSLGFIGVDGGSLKFQTSGGSYSDKLTITSSGVKQVKNGNLNIYQTYIDFSGDQSSTPQTAVALYRPADGTFAISTQNNERLRITSTGDLFVAGTGGMNTTQLPNGSTINVNGTSSNDGLSVIRYSTGYGAYGLNIGRSKSNTIGTNAAVTNGNDLGHITFYGADGTDFNQAAMITAQVDGTPSDGTDMPGRLVFKTSSDGSATPTERLRITSSGNIGVNKTTPKEWYSTYRTLQIYDGGYIAGSSDDSFIAIGANNYLDTGGTYDYTNTDYASQLYQVDGQLVFRNAPSGTADTAITWAERLRIASDGQVTFDKGAVGGANQVIARFQAQSSRRLDIVWHDSGSLLGFDLPGSHSYIFKTAGTERLRITSGGEFFFGANTSNTWASGIYLGDVTSSTTYIRVGHNATGANYSYLVFGHGSSQIGSVSQNSAGNQTLYNQTSDYRLKENIIHLDGAITRIKQLSPRRFNFIGDSDNTVDGFIAHEVATVVPQAVSGTHDEVDSDNNPVYQQIDQSKLIPVLTAALKEEIAKREALEARITALEGS